MTARRPRLAVVYGTRPELIKIAPIVTALRAAGHIDPVLICTGQHQQMLEVMHEALNVWPDVRLDVFVKNQPLPALNARLLDAIGSTLPGLEVSAVLVQGDTATTVMAAQAAFYCGLPVIHVEAGLRSGDLALPFPEEGNRRMVSHIASLHLAPTATNRDNLLAEGISPAAITVTGNTVIDALMALDTDAVAFKDPAVAAVVATQHPVVVVTCHRRENWGNAGDVAAAVGVIAHRWPQWRIIIPVHGNEQVARPFHDVAARHDNIVTTGALDYPEFVALQKRARIIISDSGGVQEEAPALGTPVLCLRSVTERPEAVAAGCVRLVGTDPAVIVEQFSVLAGDDGAYAAMAQSAHPYGRGDAAARCVEAISALMAAPPRGCTRVDASPSGGAETVESSCSLSRGGDVSSPRGMMKGL